VFKAFPIGIPNETAGVHWFLERLYGGSEKEDLMAGRDWRIEARHVEYCSCDLGCPCESMADPTYGICTGLVAFKIDKGHCEKLSLDDLAVVATFYFPRAIHHGQGVLQPIIDERASDEQRDALFYILFRRGPKGRHDVPDLFDHYRDHQGPAVLEDHFRMGPGEAHCTH
jgi:hypothetical protein